MEQYGRNQGRVRGSFKAMLLHQINPTNCYRYPTDQYIRIPLPFSTDCLDPSSQFRIVQESIIIMIDSNHLSANITLRQQQTVQQIIAEVGYEAGFELDEELKAMIESGEQLIESEYEAQAEQRMVSNRQGINFQEIKQQFELQIKEEAIIHHVAYEESELNIFQRQSIKKSKFTEQEILELDSQFPKLTYNSMVGQQQNIFELQSLEATKWLAHRKILLTDIKSAIACRVNEKLWTILAAKHELFIFMGALAAEPYRIPHAGQVTAYAISPCKRYIAVGIEAQLAVYQIKKGNNIVLLKNINDLKVKKIIKLGFYEGSTPKMYFIDELARIGLVTIEVGLILTKVKIDEIVHDLQRIDSCDIVRISNKEVLIAISGSNRLRLATIEPEIEFSQSIEVGSHSICLWRRHKEKLQLIVSYQSKVIIYKLTHLAEEQCYFLQEHLLFLNHYPINNMFLVSEFHILLESDHNFTVVGLPLIPTVVEDPDLLQSEGAIVFVMIKESSNSVLRCMEECLLISWKDMLQLGKLKCLNDYIDELMIQKSAYRQALSLLVLVSRGINYSFKFSYEIQDLKKIIYGAVQMSASALLPTLDKKIVMFRVGWVVQLCIQCKEQQMLWNCFYPLLKEKKLEKSLFEMIQIFILKNQLTAIPEVIFLEIVNYFAEKNQELVIEKLVLTNREEFEATKLLSLLNQKEMNYLQFYLFSKGILSEESDFYTPFLRSFTAFSRNVDSHHPKKVESGLLCYLILSKTFSFQYVPSGYMTRDIKEMVVKEFFLRTLSKTFMKKLSEQNLRLYLEIYLLPFLNEEFKDILFEDQEAIVERMKSYAIDEEIKSEPTFVGTFLEHFENCLGFNRNSILFAEFYATVLFVNHENAKFERIVEVLALLFQKKFYRYELKVSPQTRPTTKKLKQYLVKLIEKDLYQRLDRLYIKKLLVFEDREVGYMLHRIDKNYQASLEHYLGNHGTNGLFQFIHQIYEEALNLPEDSNFQKTRKKLQIRNFLIRNIGLLFRTDNVLALQILYMVGETTQKIHDFIFNGHFQKMERLHFLTAVLTKWESEEFQHKQKYLLEHLEEVCQLPQKQMRHYLDHFYYPLDLAIKVADQKGNFLAKAILQTRSGLIEQAFSSYQKLIKNTLLVNKEEDETRAKVNRYIQECIELCKLNSGENFEQNLWVRLMKFISSFVASEHQYKVYLKVELERSNQAIIAVMLRFLGTLLLIKFFTSPSIPLPFYKLIPIHEELYRKVKFDRIIIQRSLHIFQGDLQYLRRSISIENKLAIQISDYCDFCRGKLNEQQKNIVYSCGHSFHCICHDDTSICLTCSYESDQNIIYRNIFRKNDIKKPQPASKKKKKEPINTDIIVMTKALAKHESNRKKLKLFDYEQSNLNTKIYDLTNRSFEIDSIIYESR